MDIKNARFYQVTLFEKDSNNANAFDACNVTEEDSIIFNTVDESVDQFYYSPTSYLVWSNGLIGEVVIEYFGCLSPIFVMPGHPDIVGYYTKPLLAYDDGLCKIFHEPKEGVWLLDYDNTLEVRVSSFAIAEGWAGIIKKNGVDYFKKFHL
jgi:hypothetical protein